MSIKNREGGRRPYSSTQAQLRRLYALSNCLHKTKYPAKATDFCCPPCGYLLSVFCEFSSCLSFCHPYRYLLRSFTNFLHGQAPMRVMKPTSRWWCAWRAKSIRLPTQAGFANTRVRGRVPMCKSRASRNMQQTHPS